jgi:glycosyltransferase involved in cell wall biosynthesis
MCIYFIAVGKSALLVDTFLILLIRLCQIPYILRFGGKGYRLLKNEGAVWKFIVSFSLSNALGGIVLGQKMKRDVNMFIPNNRLVYVPNGISNKHNKSLRKNHKNIRILYLSNLVPSKGSFELLKAANILIQRNKNIRLILAGADSSPAFTNQLKSYIKRNKLDKYVKMPGVVNGERKYSLLESSDIFVLPSYFRYEVFGTVNIEAMSCGLPVVSSNEGAIPEIIQDGVNGFIINPKSPEDIANKLSILITNHDLRENMGAKGREFFEAKYTLEAHARNLDNAIMFFEKILKKGND